MLRQRSLVRLAVITGFVLLVPAAAIAAIDPATRTVDTGTITATFSLSNPDEIESISWNGSPNLTNPWANPFCPDDLEFWGNAWAAADSGSFVSLVGWGTTGTWANNGANQVRIQSRSEGCFGSAELDVATRYQFPPGGPAANSIQVKRTFEFGSSPFTQDFRPYIPRLSPRTEFNQVLHPDATGSALVTEDALLCEFGCRVSDWDDTWFAIHDPVAGTGLIVKHEASPFEVDLWVDVDGGSFANASSVLLLAPSAGFTGKVIEGEKLCFYDSSTWPSSMRDSLTLPSGC